MTLTLTETLHAHGFHELEGGSHGNFLQSHSLYYLTRPPVCTVLEIGFNTGHSAETFLQHPNTKVTSFDIGIHSYLSVGKRYIDQHYPQRHTLILGDSTQTLPTYIQEHPHESFDVIYIDGGHDEDIVHQDLENALRLSHSNTIIIMDDVVYQESWKMSYTMGPTKIWCDVIRDGRIRELAHVDYCEGRGMSWGQPMRLETHGSGILPDDSESTTQSEQVVEPSNTLECLDP